MTSNSIEIIDKKIEELSKDETEYDFSTIKQKVKQILKSVDIFFIDNKLNNRAVDMYVKSVITKRNNLKKAQEKTKVDNTKQTKYILIEKICNQYEFKNKEELILKVEELEKKTNLELNEINNSF